MSYSPIIQNIIQPIISLSDKQSKLNILYENRNTIFDKFIVEHIDNAYFFDQQTYDHNYGIFSYDIYWNNCQMESLDKLQKYKNQHILDMIFFHESPEPNVKKEDKFLLQNKLHNSLKIYTKESLKDEWGIMNNSKLIKYGLEKTDIDINKPRKSVILLNEENIRSGELLYTHIKRYFEDAAIIQNSSRISYSEIVKTIQEYKVCIVIKRSFDALLALSCGCEVLSSLSPIEDGITKVDDFNQIHLMIKSTIQKYDKKLIMERIDKLNEKYDLEIFKEKIYTTIRNRIRKPISP